MLVQAGEPVSVVDRYVIAPGTAVGGVHDTSCSGGNDLGAGAAADINTLMVGGRAFCRSDPVSEIGGYLVIGGTGPEPAGAAVGRRYFIIGSGDISGGTRGTA